MSDPAPTDGPAPQPSSNGAAPAEPVAPAAPAAPSVLGYARPGMPRPGATLVTVATFGQSWEAHLAAGKLEAEGIPASIADENIVAAGGGLYTNMTGGVKLQVHAADVDRAHAALPQRVRVRLTKCPRCQATDTREIDFTPGVKILFLCMLGLPYLFVEKSWACLDCGNVWKKQPDDEEAAAGMPADSSADDSPPGDAR